MGKFQQVTGEKTLHFFFPIEERLHLEQHNKFHQTSNLQMLTKAWLHIK